MQAWRAIDTGLKSGPMNMAVDDMTLRGVMEGRLPPTVRVYGWRTPTVSVGHAQNPEKELDLDACRRARVDVVRRPTGGRAVLHSGELTYSVVAPAGESGLGRTIMETYREIARALLSGLELLGIDAELAEVGSPRRARGAAASPPCFASAGRFEVVVSGRKVIGSAQRRLGDAVLQHGSLLIDSSHVGVAELLRLPEARRASVRRELEAKTTDLESLMGRKPEFSEVASAILRGFERAWGVKLARSALGREEEGAASRVASQYSISS